MEVSSKVFSFSINHPSFENKTSKTQYTQNNIKPSTFDSNLSLSNLRAYYLKPSFGRLKVEHLKNGAYVDEAKNVFFKLFTFSDVEKVFVDIKGKGLHELEKIEEDIFKKMLTSNFVKSGDDYRFKLVKNNGEEVFCKDPYAMRCKLLTDDYTQIYDHHEFKWDDDNWVKNKIRQKISRKSHSNNLVNQDNFKQEANQLEASNNLLPLNKMKIYEANIPALTKEGNFESAKLILDQIAKDGIFNTVHIMPVENTFSFNWGYDGVFKFAPQESQMGGPDALKEFINHAHLNKLNIIMDVVPNHIGPDCNSLKDAGPYLKPGGPFGDGFNLEGDPKNNKHVRDYLTNACINWIENYHCDGLRLDMTKFMASDNALKQIAMEIHYHYPDVVIIAEDGRNNMYKLTQPLTKEEECIGMSEKIHAAMIEKLDTNNISLDNLGLDSEWDFPFHHALKDTLENGSIYNLSMARRFSGSRIKYMMSHDEIGNLDGTRLITKLASIRMNMFNRVETIEGDRDLINCIKGQRAAHATQAILSSKVSGEYDKMTREERFSFLKKHHVFTDVTPEEVQNILNYSIAQNKLGLGTIFTSPGPNMIFMGDEKGALEYFKFFRKFSPKNAVNDVKDLANKGYEPGEKAFLDSKLDSIPYSNESRNIMDKLKNFVYKLSKIRNEHEALCSGEFTSNDIIHEYSKVLGSHLKKGDDEVFTVYNFNDQSYNGNYEIPMPKGKWKEIINSNDINYAGNGNCMNLKNVDSDGNTNKAKISLPANSLVVFQKIS